MMLFDQDVDLEDQFFQAFKAGFYNGQPEPVSDSALWFLYQQWITEVED